MDVGSVEGWGGIGPVYLGGGRGCQDGVSALGQVSQIIQRSRQLPTVQKQVKSLKTRSEIGILLRKKIVILL